MASGLSGSGFRGFGFRVSEFEGLGHRVSASNGFMASGLKVSCISALK